MTRYKGPDIRDIIAPAYYDLHRDIRNHAHTYYNLPGGRGSGKSSFIALEIIFHMKQDKTGTQNAIVFRQVARTLRESVFSQLQWAIDAIGDGRAWKATISPMKLTYLPTGAEILFFGLDDAQKLKSIKPKKGIFRYVWFEEFSEVSGELALRNVQQSILRGGNDFTVFRSFNPPISRNNWANIFIDIPDEKAVTFRTTYLQIPPQWLGDSFIYEAERLREINPKAYEHEYMGVPTGVGGEVFPEIEAREITDEEIQGMQDYVFQGVDFGFAVDPAAFIRLHYDRKHEAIYFLDEVYVKGWSNAMLAREIMQRGYNDFSITCDSAEPKSIQDLRDNGLRYCRPCYKAAGCVQYRIKWLQHRRLIFDPRRTPNAYREFSQYSYEVDRNGIVTGRLPDRDNHTCDAAAYGLNDIIFMRGYSA